MTNFIDIRDFLRAHCARYPELALQDVFKALYQSAFGCEHLIADPSAAADYIRAEAARSGDRISELVELLSGDYCRVHLGILQDGLSAETFARLFALSARHEECGREKLEAMLTALQTMADAGELPFSAQETAEAVERWRKDGFPPLHHSEIFRQNYAPAYRVLRRDFARALPLFARIDCLTAEKDRVLVAIEGGSASGKTTLGELLQNVYGCPVFHMDDFFLRPEQRTEARFAQPGGNVDLAPYYDLSVFLSISAEKQRKRILKRNAPAHAKQFFDRWIPLEQRYFDALDVRNRCDLILSADD